MGLRPFTALPWPEQTEEEFWEDSSPQRTLEAGPQAAQPSTSQEPGEAHYELWAQLSNVRDQAILVQAERRERGKPNTPYPFAPVSAYVEGLHSHKDGHFDDTVLDLWTRQVQSEIRAAVDARESYMADTNDKRQSGLGSDLSSMRRFLKDWHAQLVKAVDVEHQQVNS